VAMVKRAVGRPRCAVDPLEVVRLRHELGLSWRTLARQLAIGTATAMRLYRSVYHASQIPPEASQNSCRSSR